MASYKTQARLRSRSGHVSTWPGARVLLRATAANTRKKIGGCNKPERARRTAGRISNVMARLSRRQLPPRSTACRSRLLYAIDRGEEARRASNRHFVAHRHTGAQKRMIEPRVRTAAEVKGSVRSSFSWRTRTNECRYQQRSIQKGKKKKAPTFIPC